MTSFKGSQNTNFAQVATPGGETGEPVIGVFSKAPLCDEFGRLLVVIDGVVSTSGGGGGGGGGSSGLIFGGFTNTPAFGKFIGADTATPVILPIATAENQRLGIVGGGPTEDNLIILPAAGQNILWADNIYPDAGTLVVPIGAYVEFVAVDDGSGSFIWMPAGASNEGGGSVGSGWLTFESSNNPELGEWVIMRVSPISLPTTTAGGQHVAFYVPPNFGPAILSLPVTNGLHFGRSIYNAGSNIPIHDGGWYEFVSRDEGESFGWYSIATGDTSNAPLESAENAGVRPDYPNMWSLGSNDTSHPLPYNPLDGDSYGIYADVNCAVFCFDPGADIEAPDLSGIFSPPDLVNLSAGTYYEWIYTAGDNTWHPRQNMLMVPSAAPPASTYKAPVRVVAATSITQSGTQTIDTIAVVVGDRVLCAGQATGSANGIWIVAAGAWSRASDANTSALMLAGTIVPVTEGSANVDTEWTLTTNNPIVLGTTNLVFTISGGLRGSAAPAAISPTNIAANGASVRWAPIDHTHPMVSPYKDVCRLVATTNQTLSGLSAIDGITPNSNDRVLCAGQTTASANGIYNAQSGAWTRAADANVSSNMASGALVPVSEGTANADSLWSLTTNNPITLGSTALAFLKMLPVVSGPQIETKMLSADTSNLSNSDLTQLGFNIAAGETVIMEWCIPNIGTTTAPTPIIHLQNNLGGSQAVSRCQVHSEWNVGAAINVLDFTITTLQTLHPIQQVTSSNTASNILLKVTLTCPVAVFIRPLFERNGGPAYVKAGAWGRCTRGAVIS